VRSALDNGFYLASGVLMLAITSISRHHQHL